VDTNAGAIGSTPLPAGLSQGEQVVDEFGNPVHAAFLPRTEEQAVISEPEHAASSSQGIIDSTMIRPDMATESPSASSGRMLRGVRSVLNRA
jgi:hypothetical protein